MCCVYCVSCVVCVYYVCVHMCAVCVACVCVCVYVWYVCFVSVAVCMWSATLVYRISGTDFRVVYHNLLQKLSFDFSIDALQQCKCEYLEDEISYFCFFFYRFYVSYC